MKANRIIGVAIVGLVLVGLVQVASAVIAVNWASGEGFYKSDGVTPLLGGAGAQTALAQLIFSTDLVYDIPCVGATHYMGGADIWLADWIIDPDYSTYGEFIARTAYAQPYVEGYLYVRVFDQGSMSGVSNGMWYYNSPFTNTIDNTGFPPNPPDLFNISLMTASFGDTLNMNEMNAVIPEPATWAFLVLGLAALAGRKFRRS